MRAVVVHERALGEAVVLHPGHDRYQVGTFEDAVSCCPVDDVVVWDEDLRVAARLGERFFGSDAVAVNVVAPHRDRLGLHEEVRWGSDESDVRHRGGKNAPG
jgi:hypothetical protein